MAIKISRDSSKAYHVPVTCKLLCHSLSPHVQQLYTGFSMLKRKRLIKLTQEIRKVDGIEGGWNKKNTVHAHLAVEVKDGDGGRLTLYFDCHDSMQIDQRKLAACDFYFKRSFSQNYTSNFHVKEKDKIYPLGLNYLVLPNHVDFLALKRNVALSPTLKKKIGGVIAAIDIKNKIKFRARLSGLHSMPKNSLNPRALFIVNAYDPHGDPQRPKERIEEWSHYNEVRAACVRLLRKELGSKFYGGFIHNRYTVQKYKDLLIDDPVNAQKENYLKILDNFPVCIATTGLYGSIGWKFGEYVAFSKAIVSEKLQYEVPGLFGPQHNYLEFTSPEECVDQTVKLLNDHELRHQLMSNNFAYYQKYGRPDKIILGALSLATGRRRWTGA